MGMDFNIIRVSQKKLNDFIVNSELLNEMITGQDFKSCKATFSC